MPEAPVALRVSTPTSVVAVNGPLRVSVPSPTLRTDWPLAVTFNPPRNALSFAPGGPAGGPIMVVTLRQSVVEKSPAAVRVKSAPETPVLKVRSKPVATPKEAAKLRRMVDTIQADRR
jgi:hypothetical protein